MKVSRNLEIRKPRPLRGRKQYIIINSKSRPTSQLVVPLKPEAVTNSAKRMSIRLQCIPSFYVIRPM